MGRHKDICVEIAKSVNELMFASGGPGVGLCLKHVGFTAEYWFDQAQRLRDKTELWRKKVVAADRKIAKQAVLIEALKELAKTEGTRTVHFAGSIPQNEAGITALENVKAAQTELDKETS